MLARAQKVSRCTKVHKPDASFDPESSVVFPISKVFFCFVLARQGRGPMVVIWRVNKVNNKTEIKAKINETNRRCKCQQKAVIETSKSVVESDFLVGSLRDPRISSLCRLVDWDTFWGLANIK